MCGIAGIWGQGDIQKMVKLLSHRGPDGESWCEDGNVKLGATSLKIVDRNAPCQPLFNEERSISVVLKSKKS